MKRYITLILIILMLISIFGCKNDGDIIDILNSPTPANTTKPMVTPIPEPTAPVIMESIPEALQEKEPYVELEINNGSAYIKEYMGAVYYTDNEYIRMALPERRIISGQGYSWYPAALDIYKNALYYCEDESDSEAHRLYRVRLKDPKNTEILLTDLLSTEYTGHGGTFLVAEDTVFYLNTDRKLCSRDLTGANGNLLVNKQVADIKYRKGWLYFIDWESWYLYRMPTKGGEPEIVIEDTIDDYYLTEETIVYQTGYCTPMEYDLLEKDGSSKYYFKELGANGETSMLLEGDLNGESPYYSIAGPSNVQIIEKYNNKLLYTLWDSNKYSTWLYEYSNKESVMLTDLEVDNSAFPTIALDEWIYTFCLNPQEGFFRIKRDGSIQEKIGEYYKMPKYFLPD